MNSKTILILGVMILAAFIIFKMYMIPSQAVSPNSTGPTTSPVPNNSTQAGYPYINQGDKRADYANQPWSNTTRPQLTTPLDVNLSNLQLISAYASVGAELMTSGSQIYDAWNSFFND